MRPFFDIPRDLRLRFVSLALPEANT